MRRLIKNAFTPLMLLVLSGVIVCDHALPRSQLAASTTIDGEALGRAYAPLFLASYADAWLVAAKAIEQGKSVAEAEEALNDAWRNARAKAFKAQVVPAFKRVLPEGTEPADEAGRSEIAQFWRSFAKGLKFKL